MAKVDLKPADLGLLAAARTATLATIAPDGRPRLVPVCFALDPHSRLWIALDQKPKRGSDPRTLARVRDILARPDVSVLVERWEEDWSRLAWLRMGGRATLVEPESVPPEVRIALRARYPQYVEHDLEGCPMLAIEFDTAVRWSASDQATAR